MKRDKFINEILGLEIAQKVNKSGYIIITKQRYKRLTAIYASFKKLLPTRLSRKARRDPRHPKGQSPCSRDKRRLRLMMRWHTFRKARHLQRAQNVHN